MLCCRAWQAQSGYGEPWLLQSLFAMLLSGDFSVDCVASCLREGWWIGQRKATVLVTDERASEEEEAQGGIILAGRREKKANFKLFEQMGGENWGFEFASPQF
mmetsp:Transcript_22482/g.34289  ORF Transcript_22482/g.34289 Transcript_22482/m.34289 type:complete len:103 (+) Transcript_22482:199-507(+)